MVAAVGDIVIEVTTGAAITVKVVDPVTPLSFAVMVALPAATPVASPGLAWPVDSTVAIVALELDQAAEPVTSWFGPVL
jgi:hypothetical protein